MSELVASSAKYCNIQQVIDLGSGKGYLCSFLSMEYSLKVYGIDSSSTNTHGANERNRKLKRYSKAYQRTREPMIQETVSEIQEDHSSMNEAGLTPSEKDSVMVGLHTCGDLASSTLRIFTAKPELKAVCSVGCCYHLLSEEFDCPRQEILSCDVVWSEIQICNKGQYLSFRLSHCFTELSSM
ncbi:Methyltransferase-like protein 25 [Acipenser ruthenus]|uniref:Methyltransferase-like protein 25 n=1 Tax=Acipenser ruthenus TaxID=7906 RepID=A0A662YU63_ACIRT|nr:Methyltransferase-like protein 25 [Acipenser ruthenus]